MTSNGYTAKWLFRLLDYEHYTVSFDGEDIAQVVVNRADRSVAVMDYQSNKLLGEIDTGHGYDWWRKWLRRHEVHA